ncbi:MAG: FlgD immunoglobulin-like domain containing protein [Candidatus Krumholzibacteriia bacterium]
MTKILFSLLAVVMMAGLVSAQTIDEIQVYDPVTGAPMSPYAGQTVTVQGVVYVIAGTYNSGTHYIQGATGGISFFQSGTGLQIGDEISITGTVSTFSGEIQLSSPSITYLGSPGEPTPTAVTTGQIAHDYEYVGSFVSVIGQVTSKSASQFELATVGEDTMIVYIDSDTGINLGAVQVGDEYQVKSPVVVFNGLIELKPRMQSDLVEDPTGDTLPVIASPSVDNYVVMPGSSVTISANITDNSAVTSATLYYRSSDGENPGAWMSTAMSSMGGGLYSATVMGPNTSQLDYYYEATDDGAQTATLPGDAPTGFYSLAVGITSIYEMQYVSPDSANGDTPFLDKVLNIRGIVTAGTGEVINPSKFIVQEAETGPYGGYRYGAVLVYEGTAAGEYFQGDEVEIGGRGNEYFGLTEMEPHNGNAINLIGFGNALPEPERASTRVLRDDTLADGDGRFGEAYESVWVKTWASVVLDTLGFGEYIISDTGARADSLEVDPAVELTYQPILGNVIFVEGYMDYDFGDFQITPVADQFITLTDWVGVEDLPTIRGAGGFESIGPNPFNPATTIKFVLNRDELTQLNIYNIRGELIRSLVNERLPMGGYTLSWDGRNAEGQLVASGQYFARLRIGAEVMQVRKLSLVK